MKKTCVIQLLHTMAYGGIETIILNWMRYFQSSDIELRLVVFENADHSEKPFLDAASRFGIDVDRIPWNRLKPVVRSTRALVKLVRKYNASIIHTHNFYANLVGLLAAKWTSSRVMSSVYVWGDFGARVNAMQWIEQYLLRCFDHVTAQCERTRVDSIARGVKPARISVLGSGVVIDEHEVDAAQRTQLRAELGASNDQVVLLNVARLYPEKGHELLLRAFRKIHDQFPQTRLWIAGVGPLAGHLRSLCQELQLDHVVRWLGFVTELPALFAASDMQVHPALNEGIPLALLQGMAAGMPIVASAAGGIPEILDGQQRGIVVPVNREPEFVQAVAEFLQAPQRMRNMGAAARQYVRNEQSMSHAVTQLARIYEDLRCVPASTGVP